jgi:hypothetical protein
MTITNSGVYWFIVIGIAIIPLAMYLHMKINEAINEIRDT